MRRISILSIAFMLALGLTAAVAHAAGPGERLVNGSFEEGFDNNGVAVGWSGFNNGGSADYICRDDTGPRFAVDGKHSQFLRISTMPYFVTEPDRYSGIYQTVNVAAGSQYTLTMYGMLRVLPDDPDKNNYSYVVQVGVDPNGGTDWGKVAYTDVPWGTTFNEDDTGVMSKFTTTFTAPTNKITLFVRALKKWPTRYRTLFVNLDAISLTGAAPTAPGTGAPVLQVVPPKFPYITKPFQVHVNAFDPAGLAQISLFDGDILIGSVTHAVPPQSRQVDFEWTPTKTGLRALNVKVRNGAGTTYNVIRSVTVAPIAEFLKNGDFEHGFTPEGVALQWGSFTNDGRKVLAQLYDDTWKPVISAGKHSQLIEISTIGSGEFDPDMESDRFAGICQVVSGLTAGATYYLSADGMIRITEGDQHTGDWSWAAQWGYFPAANATCSAWTQVNNWQVFPWSRVDFRESPDGFAHHVTTFTAPSSTITLYFSAWKKWAIGAREFLVNFDNLSLAGYKAP
ncbi:MAG: hypothetical protein ACM3S0_20180 [Acidobacteriota bacterium]